MNSHRENFILLQVGFEAVEYQVTELQPAYELGNLFGKYVGIFRRWQNIMKFIDDSLLLIWYVLPQIIVSACFW